MVDINKYLETQLALAKQKSIAKSDRERGLVSNKSRAVSEFISKKEERYFKKKRQSKRHGDSKATLHPDSDADSEYIPNTRKKIVSELIPKKDEVCYKSKKGTNKSNDSLPHEESDGDSEYLPSSDEDVYFKSKPPLQSLHFKSQKTKKILDDGSIEIYHERIDKWKNGLALALSGKYGKLNNYYSADINYILEGNMNPDECYELQNGFSIPFYIWKQLYNYQRIGVKWLWELHQVQSGGMLCDEMGLGKTVQIISFLAGLMKIHSGSWGGLGPSIIIAPATVLFQWVAHFHYWCPQIRTAVLHNSGSYDGSYKKLIKDIHISHGILLVTYAGIVKYNRDLLIKKWHYIILDEGHKIRNPETQVSKFVKKFDTPHKLLITGSPMQNSLQELWSLFDFMKPGLLGTHNAFMEHFASPITQGGYANATHLQETTALEIAKALKSMITPYMLRRTKSEVQEHIKLPEKNEQVLFCTLSKEQKDLYIGYLMGNTVRSILDKDKKYGDPVRARVLVALSTLRKICNHPDLYIYEAQEEYGTNNDETFGHWERSGKMSVVFSLLKIWQKQGHRALIFSQSRAMICILEQFLQNQDYKYLKMDGTVSVSNRQSLIKEFNENSEYLVFLSTTRVGGLGINLTGADRVIIYDPDWNPATDSQAKERAWRIGQLRHVTVYRLITAGTIEEKIYQRQIFKHFLSNKILMNPNQKNVLTTSTLQGLFTFEEPNLDGDTETSSLFKHTKYSINTKENIESEKKDRVKEMRKRAKEISRKISNEITMSKEKLLLQGDIDPREKYKKKRELLLNPPEIKAPEINIINENVTNDSFENVISELDIVNIHIKKDYEKTILEKALNERREQCIEGIESENDSHKEEESCTRTKKSLTDDKALVSTKKGNDCLNLLMGKESKNHSEMKIAKKHRKRTFLSSEMELQNVVAVKKIKKKDSIPKENTYNDDDYVLSKLFAKAAVKNALQHDEVVGLAEKEKRYRMQEEAKKKAIEAINAVKFSYN